MHDGGRTAGWRMGMTYELVDRLAILVAVRRFPGMGAADSLSLHSSSGVRMQHFVRRTTYVPFRRFGGMCGENSCNVMLMVSMVLWVPISVTLCMRELLMLWHAFLFLGLNFFHLFSFWLALMVFATFSCKNICIVSV
jgi:hypothetical protein